MLPATLKGQIVVAVISSIVTVGVLAVALTATGVGFAADGDNTIHGCVGRVSGLLRVVDEPGDCRRLETPIEWNKQGPPGMAAVEQRTATGWMDPHDTFQLQSLCEAGEVVTGGGYSLGSIGFNDKINVSGPLHSPQGWTVQGFNDTDFPIFLSVTAICADLGP